MCEKAAPPGQLSESRPACPTKAGGLFSTLTQGVSFVTGCHVLSVLSWAAAEHHGCWESGQGFSPTHLLRLTHFPKVKLRGRLSSVPPALIYSLSLHLFLPRWISLSIHIFYCTFFYTVPIFLRLSLLLSVSFLLVTWFSPVLFLFCFLISRRSAPS